MQESRKSFYCVICSLEFVLRLRRKESCSEPCIDVEEAVFHLRHSLEAWRMHLKRPTAGVGS
jgi:hypothetical protein